MFSLSFSVIAPCKTRSANSEVPWSPIAFCRNSPFPSGEASGVEKCWMFCFIMASCMSCGLVKISVPSGPGTDMLVMFCLFIFLRDFLNMHIQASFVLYPVSFLAWLLFGYFLSEVFLPLDC